MDEFSIRPATIGDKEAVLGIHKNVYDGYDYLPEYYDYLLEASNAKSFVLQHRNKIIGFNTAYVIDDGYTVVSRAARVNPEYGGKGLYRFLDNHVTEWIRYQQASVKAFTALGFNSNILKPSFRTHNRRILTQFIYIYKFEPDKTDLCESDVRRLTSIREISNGELSTYIRSAPLSKYLFPRGRMIVHFVPFRLMETNVQFIRDPQNFTNVYSDIRTDSETYEGLLSFGTLYAIKAFPYRYEINMYGADMSSFKIHIIKHLMTLRETTTSTTAVVAVLDKRFRPDMVNAIMKEYGGIKQLSHASPSSDQYYTLQYLFERKL